MAGDSRQVVFRGLVVALLAAAAAVSPAAANADRGLAVVGTARIFVAADTALVTVGSDVTGPTFMGATGEATRRMSAIFAAIKSQGIADQDIVTTAYAIDPQIDEQRVVGYRVKHIVQAKVRTFQAVDAVVGAAVAAGANAVARVSFDVYDPSALIAQARILAVKDAARKARRLAAAADAWLDGVLTIDEEKVELGQNGVGRERPGQMEVGVTVTVRYALGRRSPYSRFPPPLF